VNNITGALYRVSINLKTKRNEVQTVSQCQCNITVKYVTVTQNRCVQNWFPDNITRKNAI